MEVNLTDFRAFLHEDKRHMISVVMSVFNGERYIANAIKSICKQTYTDFELIIVDDGSTDTTPNIIKKYMKIDHRIKLINNKHEGIVHSVNIGIKKARGEFIARMDADDVAHPLRFEMELFILNKYPKIGVVSTQGFYRYNNKKVKFLKRPIYSDEIEYSLISNNKIINSSTMFRRELVENVAYSKDYFLMEDYYLWVSLIGKTQFYTIPKPLILRNKRSDSVTGTYINNISEVLSQTQNIQSLALKKLHIIPPSNLYSFSSITRRIYSKKTSIDKAYYSYKLILKQIPCKYKRGLRADYYESLSIYVNRNKQMKDFCVLYFGEALKCLFYRSKSSIFSLVNTLLYYKYLKALMEENYER